MIELHNQHGQLDFTQVSPEQISALDETSQRALMTLMDASAANTKAQAHKLTAIKRLQLATAAEIEATQAFEDANLPIPFSTSAIEASLGRQLTHPEMVEARAAHDLRCRQLLEQRARNRAAGVSDDAPVSTMMDDGKWGHTAPGKKTGHAKHAIKAPRDALAKAKQEVTDAGLALLSATSAARAAELVEADALTQWHVCQRPKSQEQLLRDYVNSETARRAANVAAGLPPQGLQQQAPAKFPIDAARGRNAGPLRSAVVRRVV
jgi:hypothetical protein